MPWSNQSGGGGGPWRPNPGPWGSGPQSSGPKPPDMDELFRRSQERLRRIVPGGSFGGGLGLLAILVIALIVWLASGFFTVSPSEQGVVLRFGKHVRTTGEGLHYHWPYPIETVITPNVTENRRLEIGLRLEAPAARTTVGVREVPQESLMLTGDENIVDVNFTVVWQIKPGNPETETPGGAADYLFNIQSPEATIQAIAESAMREVIGRSELQPVLTQGRQGVERAVHDLMQRTLDSYQAGIAVIQVQMQKVDPPDQVIDAFRDVQAARADQERLQNEAQAYANRVVPEARGDAARILQAAEGYRERVINEARGAADRFNSIYAEYSKAPEVTRERMFLETMERVLSTTDKIVLDNSGNGSGVVPYLPLGELGQQQRPAVSTPAPQPPQPVLRSPNNNGAGR
ncbi:FtsH protease activity modulator HflK [Terrihabitans rhizophilus]|uniref:Protein HflK n=1 Tax=Terrihabitans rhizophilus TaxID=3092662 RepID=A0ABU4RL63_9HYPH|nr:FtsH protease activity modulator HflK [Terrihabitans sp. PJ23]MDX6805565.1 FtsH protease activity modulator HflK [Terrihabitans sp. PJ23]